MQKNSWCRDWICSTKLFCLSYLFIVSGAFLCWLRPTFTNLSTLRTRWKVIFVLEQTLLTTWKKILWSSVFNQRFMQLQEQWFMLDSWPSSSLLLRAAVENTKSSKYNRTSWRWRCRLFWIFQSWSTLFPINWWWMCCWKLSTPILEEKMFSRFGHPIGWLLASVSWYVKYYNFKIVTIQVQVQSPKSKSPKSKGLGVTLFCCATHHHHPPTTKTFLSNQTSNPKIKIENSVLKFYSWLWHSRVQL